MPIGKKLIDFFLNFKAKKMIQCKDCELCEFSEDGRRTFKCDPFQNIKEPECLTKWQILRLDMLMMSFHKMSSFQEQMRPLQDKIMKYVKRELDDIDEADRWKVDDDEQDNDFF